MSDIRTRFAPSPTGFLHIGNLRTALYCWLYARHNDGTFILRIEDTDRERSTKEAVDVILDGLKWVGLDWDEGPYYQSERLELYRKKAQELIDKGRAYMSDLGVADKGEAVVFRVDPYEEVVIKDMIHYPITVAGSTVNDFVMIKSDGYPSYNFACTVDDAEMKITDVIRGDDHISNTARQLMIHNAFGNAIPRFAHLPMINGMDGARYSKRHGAAAVTEFRDMGYQPEALFNFLALLGWSPGDDREIMTREEMIKDFEIGRVRKTPARFDFEKFNWMNWQYIARLDNGALKKLLGAAMQAQGLPDTTSAEGFDDFIALYRERAKMLKDYIAEAKIYGFTPGEMELNEASVNKFLKKPEASGILSAAVEILQKLPEWNIESIEKGLREEAGAKEISFKKLAQTIRVAVTGSDSSPPLFDVIKLVGREKAVARLNAAAEMAL